MSSEDRKIKAIYLRLRNLLAQIPLSEKVPRLPQSIVDSYHQAISELSTLTDESFDHYKVATNNGETGWGFRQNEVTWVTDAVRTQVGSLIGHLEGTYSLEEKPSNSTAQNQPQVTIVNKNTIAITLNLSLAQLVQNAQSDEERQKLQELEAELDLPKTDWGKVKNILVWAADFSKDLFFQLLPIILKHYGVS